MTMTGRFCRECCLRPALMHEQLCFDCFMYAENERLMTELRKARAGIARLERKLQIRRPKPAKKPDKNAYVREWNRKNRPSRREYNREWMRAYRARQKAQLIPEIGLTSSVRQTKALTSAQPSALDGNMQRPARPATGGRRGRDRSFKSEISNAA